MWNITSNTITITVDANLTSGTIGSSQTICYNTVPASLSFTTAPSGGTGTYSYQWYNGAGLISSATNSAYAPAALTATTNYYCLVTSGTCGTVTSNTITITVDANLYAAGTIGSAQTICYNTVPSSLLFTTAPSGGTGTYSYQWYNGAGLISSATTSTYAPSALTATTNYYCLVTSGTCGTVTSNTITITVDANLTSGTIGNAQTICYNTVPSSLSFTTAPSGGTGTYLYQWYKSLSTSITGATLSSYSPAALTSTTSYYSLVTSGSCGTVTSNTITITVDANLAAGTIGSAQTICYNTVPASLSFTTAPSGGTGTYSYQWYNGSGVISSATNSTYAPAALTATTNYYCLVTSGSCGTVTSNTITITVDANLASGTIGNAQTICYNTVPSSLSFTTAPSGEHGTYSYQWYNGRRTYKFSN